MPSDPFGAELRRRRAVANMSLTQLARQVHYDKGHLSKVERGVRPASPALAQICDAVLDAAGELRGLAPLRREGRLAGPAPTPMPHGAGRSLSDVLGLVTDPAEGDIERVSRAALHAAAADDRAAGHFRVLFDLLRQRGRHAPPNLIFPTVLTQARSLCRLADAAPDTGRARLLSMAAHYLEYAGWMVQEAGDDGRASRLTQAAVLLAGPADTPQLAPYAQVRFAELALYRGDAAQVVALAERAERDEAATGRVRALAAQRAAQGHALLGAADRCEAALDRAAGWSERPEPEPDDGIRLGSVASGAADPLIRGWCYYDLGRPEEAVALLGTAVAGMAADAVRARALFGVRLSLAHAAAGDVEMACSLADEAIDRARLVASATVGHQLRHLDRLLTRWRRRSCVRHVQARITAILPPPA